MSGFELLGRNPVRFRYTDGVMEASWTFAPADPELLLKLQRMLRFVFSQEEAETAPSVLEVALAQPDGISVRPLPKQAPVPNGWELLADAEDEA